MIYISLGSNEGNRLDALHQAVTLLKKILTNVQCSIILETEALLPKDAPLDWNKPFLNMVVSGNSHLLPEVLLGKLKSIERQLGRLTYYKAWSPRVIDLDILLWDDWIIDTPTLTIPHRELHNRPFLLNLLALMGVTHLQTYDFKPCFLKSWIHTPRLVGILNITEDSFSDGGKFNTLDKAIARAVQLAEEGASIIEIGAQSTRPGAVIQSPEIEYALLQPVLDALMPWMKTGLIKISIDTFWSSVIQRTLMNYPIAWINDVKGELDDATLHLIIEQDCQLCIMHSLGIPPKKSVVLPLEQNPIEIIKEWAEINIERLLNLGFKKENIIIDPGIGFGKSTYQSIQILRNLKALKLLDVSILLGHSRKSYIETFAIGKPAERDLDTISASICVQGMVDFLRVHNVVEHMRFLVGSQVISGSCMSC